MRNVGFGAIAAGFAAICLPPDLAAQETNLDIIVLAGTNQVVLQRKVDKVKTTAPVASGIPSAVAPQPGSVPVWVPRIREGAPASRIGGATRAREKPVEFKILVPEVDEAALTLAAQPNLHWHLSEDTKHSVNFTLIDPEAIDPIVDAMIPGPFEAGYHMLSLADYEAQLNAGGHYEWFIAVVPDPNNRSSDTVARGAISRIEDAELSSQVAETMKSKPSAVAGLLAQSGIWYEAIDALSQLVEQNPEDNDLRTWRSAMLQQVGLDISEESE
jgi:hypothetical protein